MKIVDGTLNRTTSPEGCKITFLTRDVIEADKVFSEIKSPLEVKIKPVRRKRSLDANSYMWVLCDKIAQVVRHSTKVDVYRRAVQEVGKWTDVAIITRALPTFLDEWNNRGDGWFADVASSKLKDCTKVRCYYGSSVYDTKEMSRLIDYLVQEAKELGIETLPPDELKRLSMEWGAK